MNRFVLYLLIFTLPTVMWAADAKPAETVSSSERTTLSMESV